jgi:hypothetical protein
VAFENATERIELWPELLTLRTLPRPAGAGSSLLHPPCLDDESE